MLPAWPTYFPHHKRCKDTVFSIFFMLFFCIDKLLYWEWFLIQLKLPRYKYTHIYPTWPYSIMELSIKHPRLSPYCLCKSENPKPSMASLESIMFVVYRYLKLPWPISFRLKCAKISSLGPIEHLHWNMQI